jgi:hypothetical protein
VVRGWAIELVLIGLFCPVLVAATAAWRALLPAVRSLRTRISCWLFAGAVFYLFGLAGAWPSGARRPPNPALPATGNWPAVALVLFAVVAFSGWLVSRQRLVRRRVVSAEEELGGQTVALIGLAVLSLLILATNPYALLFALPPLHAWLWLPHLRERRPELRFVALAIGLAGPLIVVFSLAVRYHLGFDAPWYLLELAGLGYISPVAVALTLAGGAAGAQLVAVAAGRYAPYPQPGAARPAGHSASWSAAWRESSGLGGGQRGSGGERLARASDSGRPSRARARPPRAGRARARRPPQRARSCGRTALRGA